MSNPAAPTIDPLEALHVRVRNLSNQLNRYIQANGCSKALKAKAATYFGQAETPAKECADVSVIVEKLEA